MVVLKDGKEDRGGNAYVQQQVPEDFANYVIELQKDNETLRKIAENSNATLRATNEKLVRYNNNDGCYNINEG